MIEILRMMTCRGARLEEIESIGLNKMVMANDEEVIKDTRQEIEKLRDGRIEDDTMTRGKQV